ncbi:MAG: hypothetical protein ABR579_01825 [Actinomycetota bacterium]
MDPGHRETTARLTRAYWIGWANIAGAAAIGFLSMLAVGAVLLIAAKLDYLALGAHSDPIKILTAIVLFGLATLRVPIGIAHLSLAVLPLGALIVFGWGLAGATRKAVGKKGPAAALNRVFEGARVAVPFALMCWLAALIFRFRGGPNPVAANAGATVIAAAVWALIFGATGGLLAADSPTTLARDAADKVRARSKAVVDGLIAGVWMTVAALVLATAALLLWIIVGLAHGTPHGFGAADAGAAAIYLIAFLPNVVIAVVTISLGASVTTGARFTFGGKALGTLHTYSYFGWGHRSTPLLVFFLIAIPVVTSIAGGWFLNATGVTSDRLPESVAVTATTFAVPLAVIAAIGSARLGAGLVQTQGVGVVAATAWQVLLLAFGWAVIGCFAGWFVAERAGPNRRDRSGA